MNNFQRKHWENGPCDTVHSDLVAVFIMLFGVKLSHESGTDSIGHGARVPTFTNDWERGAPRIEKQKTRKWQNCTDHHERAHQND